MTPERLHGRQPNVSNDNFEQISHMALDFDQVNTGWGNSFDL